MSSITTKDGSTQASGGDRNSSYFGSKYRSCAVQGKVLRCVQFVLHKSFVDHNLGRDIC
jgi:hypothetical protein